MIERGGRVHFPDVMRRMFAAGVVGCLFIESELSTAPRATYDGFHSSGHQKAHIPILRLSKSHADELVNARPIRVQIRMLHGQAAIQRLKANDTEDAVIVSCRSGEIDVLDHLLRHSMAGSVVSVSLFDR